MAKYTKAEFRVGILVLAAVIFLAVGVAMIGGPFKRTGTIYIYFNMVKGLNQGDLVKLAGVRIGWVENMVHSPVDDNPYGKDMVKLVCKIYSDRFPVLGEKSRAYIESSGIVGEYYIELGFRPPGTPELLPEGYILGEEPYGIEDITRGLAENLASLQNIIGDEKARKDFHKTIANLSDLTEKVSYAFGDVGSVTETMRMFPKIAREAEEGVRSFRDAAENVNRLVGSATPQISSSIENVNAATARVRGEFLDQVSQILTKLDKVSEDLRVTSEDVRGLVSSNRDRVDATLASVEVAAGTLAVSMERADRIIERWDRLSAGVERGEGTIGKLLVDKTWEEKVEIPSMEPMKPWGPTGDLPTGSARSHGRGCCMSSGTTGKMKILPTRTITSVTTPGCGSISGGTGHTSARTISGWTMAWNLRPAGGFRTGSRFMAA